MDRNRLQRPSISDWSPWLRVVLAVAIAAAYLLGAFVPADRMLSDFNFGLVSRHATGSLVLVEMDARSLQKLNSWPWSRAYHAALIGRLAQAGATAIAFDIDFSAESDPAADAVLAESLKQARGIAILAGFAQAARQGTATYLSESTPLPAFQSSARVGLVNIFADSDGRPRHYRLKEDRLPDGPATMAALLANAPASESNEFAIDYGIDPNTIPRLSYVDVLTGHFDPTLVKGRKVLVGATAIELGDRYAVPRSGILSGVEIQALAYESLVLHRAIHPAAPIWVLLGLVALLTLSSSLVTDSWRRMHGHAFGAAIATFAIGSGLQNLAAIAIATAPWLAFIGANFLLDLMRYAERHATAATSHRRAALRHKALMESVFHDSFDGILIADAAGRVELANAAAARLLETPPAALIGRGVSEILGVTCLGDAGAWIGDAPAREVTLATPTGGALTLAVVMTRSRPLSTAGVAEPDADAAGVWVVTFRDESARRATEIAREQILAELQAATSAKNQFLARMSHELRTPLSAIIGFSTIIGEQRLGPVGNPKYAEYARDIHGGGQHLLDLVNDIIDVARIEALQYQVRPDLFEMRSLLASCAAAASQREECGARSLSIEVEAGTEVVRSDRQILAKAIAKLLSNAMKFTAPDGCVVLRARAGSGHAVAIEVEDNGIGIAESAIAGVVGAFSQISGGLDRRHGGTGLGLYFANRLIGLLGGRMEITSTVGAGTTVRLELPDARVEESQAA